VSKRIYFGPLPEMPGRLAGNRFIENAATVSDLIVDAYHVQPYRVLGAPGWAGFEGEGYEIQATTTGAPTADRVRLMLQSLLSDRFHLRLHRETRSIPVYELRIAKGGPKMTASPPVAGKKPPNITQMTTIVSMISGFLDRPLVDRTGLDGFFKHNWDENEVLRELRAGNSTAGPSVFTVVKDRLGLELKSVKSPFEVLVIDHVERPSPN
jgi:uncharacterized protein (TIGR03435 family)